MQLLSVVAASMAFLPSSSAMPKEELAFEARTDGSDNVAFSIPEGVQTLDLKFGDILTLTPEQLAGVKNTCVTFGQSIPSIVDSAFVIPRALNIEKRGTCSKCVAACALGQGGHTYLSMWVVASAYLELVG
jgi:hypothetical protein